MTPPTRVPSDDASWEEVLKFAWAYNGYEHFGTEGAFAVAASVQEHLQRTGSLPDDLPALRCALFMAQRAAYWTDFCPETDGAWMRQLVAKIRELSGGSLRGQGA